MTATCQTAQQAASVLKGSAHNALRQVRVEGGDGALILSGTVSSYYLKQLAQELLMRHRGELRLDNRICVSGG